MTTQLTSTNVAPRSRAIAMSATVIIVEFSGLSMVPSDNPARTRRECGRAGMTPSIATPERGQPSLD